MTHEPDPRYELAFAEAVRAIQQQDATLESLRARAGAVVAAASISTSFLGAAALTRSKGTPLLAVAALTMFVICLGSVIVVLAPYKWRFACNPMKLVRDYIESEIPSDLDEMRRDLALHIQEDIESNGRKLTKLWWCLGVALAALGAAVLLWAIELLG